MKFLLIFICLLASGPFSRAGALGWLTAREVDWTYVQATGGLKIGEPAQRGHRWVLPVEYDVHGMRGVTCSPTRVNSAPHLWRAKIIRDGARLYLTVIVSLAGKNDDLTAFRDASLNGIPAGRYEVFYGDDAVADRVLGMIEIPPQTSVPFSP